METTTEHTISESTQERIDGLRAALFILEANPELANAVWIPDWAAYVYDKEQFDRLRRQLGPHTKTVTDWSARATRSFGDGSFELAVSVNREEVCTKTKVGEKTVERKVPPEGVEMLTVVETEDVYEWVCPDSWGDES